MGGTNSSAVNRSESVTVWPALADSQTAIVAARFPPFPSGEDAGPAFRG